jgi:hypothetical protein
MVQWGSVAEWVAGVGALLAFAGTIALILQERRSRRREDERRARGAARFVRVERHWDEGALFGTLTIRNDGPAPVFHVAFRSTDPGHPVAGGSGVTMTLELPYLAPGGRVTETQHVADVHGPTGWPFILTFVDESDFGWSLDERGALTHVGAVVRPETVELVQTTRHERAGFTVEAKHEYVGDAQQWEGTPVLSDRTIVTLRIEALGRGGAFSAYFSNVRGARRTHPDAALGGYEAYAAWTETEERTNEIGYRGVAHVILAWCYREPTTFAFVVPKSAAYSPRGIGPGWLLRPVGDRVEIDVRVIDETSERAVEGLVTIGFDKDHRVSAVAFSTSGAG